jgi:hypothetical protein
VLHLLNLEEIEGLLLKVPALVRRFDERDPEFVLAVKTWLADAEDTLAKNRLSQTSEIAVCRGALISVERGFTDAAARQSRVGARTMKEARASQLLKRATDVIAETVRPRRGQLDEAERLMMQVVAVAEQLGLIPRDTGGNHTAYLQSILLALSARAELVPLVVHVTGLLGKADTLVVLDRSIASLKQ